MIKRLTACIVCAALFISMCGCGSIFDKEYSSVSDYSNQDDASNDGKSQVKTYFGLKQAILQLVNAHEEGGVIVFGEYDGDISTDLSSACWEMRTQNALCAYCVESISYDLNHIVSYDEATVYIKYSRTSDEINRVETVAYSTGIKDHLLSAMESLQNKLVLLVNNSALDEEGIIQLVSNIYMEDPQCTVNLPDAVVHVYSGSGLQRLYEITLNYGETTSSLAEKKQKLDAAVANALTSCKDENTAKSVLNAARYITARSGYSENSGSSAYAAIISGNADSKGLALGFKALCNGLNIECQVVSGLLNYEDHSWNIIKIDNDYYHIDLSRCLTEGYNAGFMRSDVDMWGEYRWDTAEYSECRGQLTYEEVSK